MWTDVAVARGGEDTAAGGETQEYGVGEVYNKDEEEGQLL